MYARRCVESVGLINGCVMKIQVVNTDLIAQNQIATVGEKRSIEMG